MRPMRTASVALAAAAMAALTLPGAASGVAASGVSASGVSALVRASAAPTLTGAPSGFTPADMRAHYGFNSMGNDQSGAPVDGRGQIIGIVLWGAEPDLGEEMAGFIKAYGLEAMNGLTAATACTVSRTIHAVPCLQVVAAGTEAPPVDNAALNEGAADAEWAHVTAPGADILFVEDHLDATGDATPALDDQAIDLAVSDGASVVSMSWSDPKMTSADNGHFNVATTGFVSGLGDFGCPDDQPYPAASTFVLSVGGTALSATMSSEPAWSKTGGFVNTTETRPGYQLNWTTSSDRVVNDVSYNAVNYSVYRYSVADKVVTKGWQPFVGVSVGIPQWAGLIADADQSRVAMNKSVLAGSGLLTAIYLAANSNEPKAGVINPAMFKDIKTGAGGTSAGCQAVKGFDEPTGLGVPQAAGLVPELADI